MRIWSVCVWLLLMSPNLAFSAEEGTSSGTDTSEEEPDCE
jgi:hypothetical protein